MITVTRLNIKELRNKSTTANQKYMSIAVSVVREHQSSAQTFVVRGQDNARKSATAYISIRYWQLYVASSRGFRLIKRLKSFHLNCID
jgi:hypothetical protein